jgi:hypothetical protein
LVCARVGAVCAPTCVTLKAAAALAAQAAARQLSRCCSLHYLLMSSPQLRLHSGDVERLAASLTRLRCLTLQAGLQDEGAGSDTTVP